VNFNLRAFAFHGLPISAALFFGEFVYSAKLTWVRNKPSKTVKLFPASPPITRVMGTS